MLSPTSAIARDAAANMLSRWCSGVGAQPDRLDTYLAKRDGAKEVFVPLLQQIVDNLPEARSFSRTLSSREEEVSDLRQKYARICKQASLWKARISLRKCS